MKFSFSSLNPFSKKDQDQITTANQQSNQSTDELINDVEDGDEVSSGTKVKVIMALLVVGFAGYVAYWVQQPSELKTDVFQTPTQTESQSQADQMNMDQSSLSTTQEVSIANFQFDPSVLTVEKGTTIIWTNKDATPHTVTSDGFSSNSIAPGQSFTYTFNNDGTYNYYCAFHPQMKAKIIVGTGTNTQVPLSNTQQLEDSNATDTQNSTQVVVSQNDSNSDVITDNTAHTPSDSDLTDTFLTDSPLPKSSNHAAAPDSLSTSVTKVLGNDASSSTTTNSTTKARISNSGPEDYIYALLFCGILYFNRRKIFGFQQK